MSGTKICRLLMWVTMAPASALVAGGAQTAFPTPDKAVGALLDVIEAGDYPLFLSIAGSQMAGFWGCDDPLRDTLERDHFLDAARSYGYRTEAVAADRLTLFIRGIAQPFPAPLVKTERGWLFDGQTGAREI